MRWNIFFTKQAKEFIEKQDISEQVFSLIKLSIQKFQGENVSINIRKMQGGWSDFYRIRKGKWRIIVSFDFAKHIVFIEAIDWRGNIYKK